MDPSHGLATFSYTMNSDAGSVKKNVGTGAISETHKNTHSLLMSC